MELDTFTKRTRLSGVGGGSSAGGPDLLSNLPDCLLHTIMSFLKARQVVQTCVLSTRWRHLWRSVPCLDIDIDEFNKAAPSDGHCTCHSSRYDSSSSRSGTSDSDTESWKADYLNKLFTKNKNWEDFEDFVVTLMRRCDIAQLDSFRLRVVQNRAPKFGNRVAAGWLRRAMKYSSPGRAIQQGLSFGSWRLKRLHLCHVLLDDKFLNLVNSVCLSLEDLELDDCSCEIQSITSQSLKTLVLRKCRWHNLSEIILPRLKTLVIDGGSNTDACMLVIMAPTLAHLHLAVDVYKFRGGVSLGELPTVAKALIHLRQHIYYSYLESKFGGDQFKLLCSISDSINLELLGLGSTVLGKEPRFQEFKNLRNLLLDRCDLSDDLKTLVFFVQGSPILEKLTLRRCKFPEYSNKKKGTPMLRFQEFKNLRSLLLDYYDLSDDFKTLVFFLRSSPTLEKLTLRCCEFPKCSRKKKPMPIRDQISSSELCELDLLCENLQVEILYHAGDGFHLPRLLQRVSVNLSKNNVKLTKVD